MTTSERAGARGGHNATSMGLLVLSALARVYGSLGRYFLRLRGHNGRSNHSTHGTSR